MTWLVIPLGALIGFLTNYIAVRMVLHWLLPRKERALHRAVISQVLLLLPWYLKIPFLEKKVEEDLSRALEKQSAAEMGKLMYAAGGNELRIIEGLGAVVGATVAILGLLL